jgi:hypothetical protein
MNAASSSNCDGHEHRGNFRRDVPFLSHPYRWVRKEMARTLVYAVGTVFVVLAILTAFNVV